MHTGMTVAVVRKNRPTCARIIDSRHSVVKSLYWSGTGPERERGPHVYVVPIDTLSRCLCILKRPG